MCLLDPSGWDRPTRGRNHYPNFFPPLRFGRVKGQKRSPKPKPKPKTILVWERDESRGDNTANVFHVPEVEQYSLGKHFQGKHYFVSLFSACKLGKQCLPLVSGVYRRRCLRMRKEEEEEEEEKE